MPNVNTILLFVLEKLLAFLQEEVHLRRTGEPLPGGSRRQLLNIQLPARKARAGSRAVARRMNPAVPLLVAAGMVLVGAWWWRNRQNHSQE